MFSVKSRHRRGLTEIDRRTGQFDCLEDRPLVCRDTLRKVKSIEMAYAKRLRGVLEKIVSCCGLSANWNLGG